MARAFQLLPATSAVLRCIRRDGDCCGISRPEGLDLIAGLAAAAGRLASRFHRTWPVVLRLWVLLLVAAPLRMQAQLAPLDHVFVVLIRTVGSDQFTLETGVLNADGRYVSDNNPTTSPLFVLSLSQAQLAAINGKPLFALLQWDTSGQYSRFSRSPEVYNILGIDYFIISATGSSAVAPAITTPPVSQTVNTGATVTLTVVATGTAPLSYQWRKDGVAIAGATSATLVRSNVTAADAGNYTVVVSNSVSSVTSVGATVTVIVAQVQPGTGDLFATGFGSSGVFYRVNSSTAATTQVGQTTFLPGLDFRANGVLYGASSSLYTVSTSNGAATLVGALPDLIVSIAFSPTDRLYGVSNDGLTLYEIDPASGKSLASVPLTGTTFSSGGNFSGEINGIDFGPDGTLYGIGFALYRINPATGVATRITPLGRDAGSTLFTDLDFGADGQLRAATIGTTANLYAISPVTGIGQLVGSMGTAINGLASAPGPATTGARLVNLSILAPLAGGETMTMGAVLGGANTSGTKALLARAAGPSLTQLGVTGVLPSPTMTLNNTTISPPVIVAVNAGWGGATTLSAAFAAVGAFPYASTTSKDSALFQPSLATGNYTVQVRDANGSAGTVITELYDSTPASAFTASTPRLVNVSVLKQITVGGSITMGFVVGGAGGMRVLLRAVGPTLGLAPFNIAGVMANPKLELINNTTQQTLSINTGWGGGTTLTTAFTSVGAFQLANANTKDSVLLVVLAPGQYSARVSGADGGGGTVIVEVYEMP